MMVATAISPVSAQHSRPDEAQLPLATPPFEFHSGFWINLHHFLYSQALPAGRSRPMFPDMAASDQKTWGEAVAFYRGHMVERDFVADDRLQRIDSYLAKIGNAPAISSADIGSDVSAVLTSAAPVYKRYWWPIHDASNHFWIKTTQSLLTSLGPQICSQLASAYETQWPEKLIRVDVSVYANWAGAYTNIEDDGQIHTVLSSETAANQGFDALETLFHEASHGLVQETSGRVAKAIQSQATAHHAPVPANLWHALIFYTVGEFVRRDLDHLGVHDFQPYADKQGLWDRGWQSYRSVLSLFWRAHMDGNLSLDDAMSQIMSALVVTHANTP
jgi:hypothetical protein